MAVILGIDLGTQSVKAILLDSDKGTVAVAGKDYDVVVPLANFAEEDADQWWEAVKYILTALKKKAPAEFSSIACIGLTGQMHGLVALDKNREAVIPPIIWVDQRSKKQVEEIYRKVDSNDIVRHIHNRIFTGFAFPSLLWIKQERPELYAKIDKICSPKDFIRMRLTSELACEVTDASAMTMFDMPSRNWYYEITDLFGIDRHLFPECHESIEIAGSVTQSAACETGLKKGVPVIYGCGDQSALIMGNGVYKEGLLVANIGTGATMATCSTTDVYDEKLRMHTFCNATEKSYAVFGAILGGGISMHWLRDNVLKAKDYSEMTKMAEKAEAGSEGLFFLPYLGGERTPHMNPNAEGMFFGLKLKHDTRHLVRSVMEGVVYAMKDCLTVMKEAGVKTDKIIASGGGAKSPLWLQMQADIFEKEISVTSAQEQAAIGSALLAGVGTGIYKDAEEACKSVIKFEDKKYVPNKNNFEIYRDGYQIFRDLYRANEGIMNHVAEIWNGRN